MRRVITSLIITVFSQVSHANEDNATLYSIICKGEQSTGFDWKDGNWKQVRFNPRTYLISKLKADDKHPLCVKKSIFPPVLGAESKTYFDQCYQMKIFGGKIIGPGLDCTEIHKMVNNTDTVYRVICYGQSPSIMFEVDGDFVYTSANAPFLPDNSGQKDSLVIEIGKCAGVP